MRTKDNINRLRNHKQRLAECNTFEAFRYMQLAFLDELIGVFEKEEATVYAAAQAIIEEHQ